MTSTPEVVPSTAPTPGPITAGILAAVPPAQAHEVEQFLWIIFVLIGLFFALFVLHRTYVNWVFQSYEKTSLRYQISRSHFRRAVIKTICQLLFVIAGVYSFLAPQPIRPVLQLEQLILGFVFIAVAILLDIDLFLDYRLLQKLRALE